jgi:hypothetical protein
VVLRGLSGSLGFGRSGALLAKCTLSLDMVETTHLSHQLGRAVSAPATPFQSHNLARHAGPLVTHALRGATDAVLPLCASLPAIFFKFSDFQTFEADRQQKPLGWTDPPAFTNAATGNGPLWRPTELSSRLWPRR